MAKEIAWNDAPEATEPRPEAGNSYGRILKSSALIGGASIINIGIGMVRTKAMAMLLGPSGMGLMGLYGAIFDLAQSVAGLGINASGVRQIAAAAGSGETARIARTAQVLRRTTLFLGLLGAALLIACAPWVSRLTFGDETQTYGVALLSAAVFCRVVSDSQSALIQGLRRIADLAKMGILGALYGTFVAVPIVYWLGESGVVPSLVAVALATLATSWWYSRRVDLPRLRVKALQIRREQAALLKLGFAFMASGLMVMGMAYFIRLLLTRKLGIETAGLYQSAWALSGMYVGLILQAMGTDFYPRLTAIADDNPACNRMVNEQAHISLLLAGPGVIGTLVFAPLVIDVFYTAQFQAAVDVLRWLTLGMALRIVSWPMGFIVLAKGEQGWFFLGELLWIAVYLGAVWLAIEAYGLNGAGIGFLGSYVFHCLLIYAIVRRMSGFSWSEANRQANLFYLPLIALVFCGCRLLPSPAAWGFGLAALLLGGLYSLRTLLDLVSLETLPHGLRRLLGWLEGGRGVGIPGRAVFLSHGDIARWGYAFMLASACGLWAYWYGDHYGWPPGRVDWRLLAGITR